MFPPFSASLVVDHPANRQLWILNAACPVSARQTRLFCPLDLGMEISIPADRTSVAYRRLLKQMGLSLAYAG